MKMYPLFMLFGVLFFLYSCETNHNSTVSKETFSGYVQKGPFLNGSSVMISELDNNLNQTGRSYSTTVADNSGSFEQKQIELITNYVQLKADGYYFNEVSAESSTGQLTLYALADISDVNTANVNVLTHLEKSRVEYLVQQNGLSFTDAKKQAQGEVLSVFSLEMPANVKSESLNFSSTGDNNAILLAISCILQGKLSTAKMSELMANIITDIKTDGKLDNTILGSDLIDNARLIYQASVRANLETKYAQLGLKSVVIPDFEKYVHQFMEKTAFTPVKIITYPVAGDYGLNLLNDTVSRIPLNTKYSFKANLPEGTDLRIVMKGNKNVWGYAIAPAPLNWLVSNYNNATQSQEFKVIESNINNDLYISFGNILDFTTITIEYYENGATTPTRIRTIEVGSTPAQEIIYPFTGAYGTNLLNSYDTLQAYKAYSMKALLPKNSSLKIKLIGGTWVTEGDVITSNWTSEAYVTATQSQEFNVANSSLTADLKVIFTKPETISVEFYEDGIAIPVRTKFLWVF